MLSQAAVDAKGKEDALCLATVAVEITALQGQEQQLKDLPVETTENDGSPDNPSDGLHMKPFLVLISPIKRYHII